MKKMVFILIALMLCSTAVFAESNKPKHAVGIDAGEAVMTYMADNVVSLPLELQLNLFGPLGISAGITPSFQYDGSMTGMVSKENLDLLFSAGPMLTLRWNTVRGIYLSVKARAEYMGEDWMAEKGLSDEWAFGGEAHVGWNFVLGKLMVSPRAGLKYMDYTGMPDFSSFEGVFDFIDLGVVAGIAW